MQDIFDIQRRPSLQELIVDWPKLAAHAKEKVREKVLKQYILALDSKKPRKREQNRPAKAYHFLRGILVN